MVRVFIALFGACLALQAHALPCFLTMVKDSCWTGYDLTVDLIDTSDGHVITSIIVPQGESWTRQTFNCQAGQTLAFQTKFSPIFWKDDEGKVYRAKKFWTLPRTVAKNESAWNITLCYADGFAEVPFPPDAKGHCKCDFKHIPPVKPQ